MAQTYALIFLVSLAFAFFDIGRNYPRVETRLVLSAAIVFAVFWPLLLPFWVVARTALTLALRRCANKLINAPERHQRRRPYGADVTQ